jgi:hypothetical protein
MYMIGERPNNSLQNTTWKLELQYQSYFNMKNALIIITYMHRPSFIFKCIWVNM